MKALRTFVLAGMLLIALPTAGATAAGGLACRLICVDGHVLLKSVDSSVNRKAQNCTHR